jgi:hypothetical protein
MRQENDDDKTSHIREVIEADMSSWFNVLPHHTRDLFSASAHRGGPVGQLTSQVATLPAMSPSPERPPPNIESSYDSHAIKRSTSRPMKKRQKASCENVSLVS